MLSLWNNKEYKTQLETDMKIYEFLQCAAEGNLPRFRSCLENGIDINSILSQNTKIKLQKTATNTSYINKSALMLAIENGQPEIVNYIIYGHLENLKFVLSENVDRTLNYIFKLQTYKTNSLDHMALILLDKHKVTDSQLLLKAAKLGLNNTVAKLLKFGINPNEELVVTATSDLKQPTSALGLAIYSNNIGLARILLAHQANLIKCTNKNSLTATFELCLERASCDMLNLIYADLNLEQKQALTIIDLIHLALNSKTLYQADIILQLGHMLTDDELIQNSKDKNSLLFAAAKYGCVELMQHLINRGVNPGQVNSNGQTALFLARKPDLDEFHPLQEMHVCNHFAEKRQIDDTPNFAAIIPLLTVHGLDINQNPKIGCRLPPIAHAIINHLNYALDAFIENGAYLGYEGLELNYLNSNPLSFPPSTINLYINLKYKQDTFVPANCPFAKSYNTVYKIETLHGSMIALAAISNNVYALKKLLETNKLSEKTKLYFVNQIVNQHCNQTLLMFLAQVCGDSHYEVVRILVNRGVNLYAKNMQGKTALVSAFIAENLEISHMLSSSMCMDNINGLFYMSKRTILKILTREFDQKRPIHTANNKPSLLSETSIVPYNRDKRVVIN